MVRWLGILVGTLRGSVRTRRELALENLALRQQLAVWKARQPRPPLRATDRIFWVVLSRLWTNWRHSLQVRPETVVGWHRQGFRRYWAPIRSGARPGSTVSCGIGSWGGPGGAVSEKWQITSGDRRATWEATVACPRADVDYPLGVPPRAYLGPRRRRNSRISAAIAVWCVSSAKCPVSKLAVWGKY
jgi:hypothetical protein